MNTFDLGKILDEVHWEEYAEFDNPPHRIKSLRHRLRMRRIMNRAVAKHDEPIQRTRLKLSPRKVLILLVLIFTAIITAAAIIVWYGNIYGQRHSDNTELFAVVDGAPEVIEDVYELMYIPDGFEYAPDESYGGKGDEVINKTYINKSNRSYIVFEQSTRKKFTNHIDIERMNTTEIKINENKAVIAQGVFNDEIWIFVFYDDQDYILTLSTTVSLKCAIEIVKSATII